VRDGGGIRHDPLPLLPLLGQATSHLGLIATVATTFYPPFLAARLFSTLDHLTKGRVGINLVTATLHQAAQNYGYPQQFEHDLRYEMADEWTRLVTELWDSWEPGAYVADEKSGVLVDHTKIHTIDFEGQFYSSRGPLNVIPGPQRKPVICQAGGSPAGRAFAAKHSEIIIATATSPDAMKEYREDIRQRMIGYGRDPDDAKILFLVSPTVGDTDASARERLDTALAAQAADMDAKLAGMSYVTGKDLSKFDLDEPFDPGQVNGHRSSAEEYTKAKKTLRELVSSNSVSTGVDLVGTPETVADTMEELMDHIGGDGFLIILPVTRRHIAEITDGLAPVLRKRGLIRSEYTGATFRENLLAF
jgi:FMN-dependent oxidoreductase (nitrilotriacetate monooxygenase family)